MPPKEYSYEIQETGSGGLNATIALSYGGERIAGLATQTSHGSWTVTLFDGHGSDASATALDRADALALLDFHAGLVVRLMKAEAVTA
ncbi:hypothetical protein ABQF35_14500 [Mycobacterium syngnathidarum]